MGLQSDGVVTGHLVILHDNLQRFIVLNQPHGEIISISV